MATNILQHMKGVRSRSVHLEKGSVRVTAVEPVAETVGALSSKRSSSQPSGIEVAPGTPRSSVASTLTTRPYRSMLDVEEPPTIRPLKPMSYDELYPPPRQPSATHAAGKDEETQKTPVEPTEAQKRDQGCGPGQQSTELSSRISLPRLVSGLAAVFDVNAVRC
jgi:hypothetical protein